MNPFKFVRMLLYVTSDSGFEVYAVPSLSSLSVTFDHMCEVLPVSTVTEDVLK